MRKVHQLKIVSCSRNLEGEIVFNFSFLFVLSSLGLDSGEAQVLILLIKCFHFHSDIFNYINICRRNETDITDDTIKST